MESRLPEATPLPNYVQMNTYTIKGFRICPCDINVILSL